MKRILPPRLLAAVTVTAALFVPLAVFGGSALARSAASASQYQYAGSSGQYQYRVQVCHRTHSKKHPFRTITVSVRAVKAHLRHGDHVGACTGTEQVAPKQHGNGSGQNKGDDDDQGQSGVQHGNGKNK
jgi:hypothetical protein